MGLIYTDQFVGYGNTGTFSNPLPYLGTSGWLYGRAIGTFGAGTTNFRVARASLAGQSFDTNFFEIVCGSGTGQTQNQWGRITKLLDVPTNYLVIGLSIAATTGLTSDRVILRFDDVFTNSEVSNSVVITTLGEIRCNGVTSAPGIYSPYVYLTFEFDGAAGEIRVYKGSDITTPVLIAPTSLTEVSQISWGAGGGSNMAGAVHRFAGVYLLDGIGSHFNGPLGIIQYKPLALVSALETGFVPSGGAASNLAAINKDTRSFDTYNRSQVSNGLYDRFAIDASTVDPTDTVLGVVLHTTALRDIGEPRTLALEINDAGGTVGQDFSDLTVGAWTDNRYSVFTTEGDGATPLTPASLANLKVGYRVKA